MELGREVTEVSIILRTREAHKSTIQNLCKEIDLDLNSESYEIILVDDSIGQICKVSQKNLKIVKTGGGKGASRALELGARSAKFQFCAIQDDDDPYVEGRVSEQIQRLLSSGMVYCVAPIVKVTPSGKILPQPLGLTNYENYSTNWLLLGSYGGDASLVWDQKKSGPLNLPKNIDNFGDWVWALENLWDTNTTHSTQTRYLYTQHSGQLTRRQKNTESEFSTLFYSWAKRQEDLNLPDISITDLKGLIKPYFGMNLKNWKSEGPYFWLRDFLQEMKIKDRCNNDLEILISRKMSLNTIFSIKWMRFNFTHLTDLFDTRFALDVLKAFRYRR
jgi:hypothetical protein